MFDWVLDRPLPTSISMCRFCGEKQKVHQQSLINYCKCSSFSIYSFTTTEMKLNCNDQKLTVRVDSRVAEHLKKSP